MKNISYYNSPLGFVKIVCRGDFLVELSFVKESSKSNENRATLTCKEQLSAYFKGDLKSFDLQIDFEIGTEFQKKVWNTLLKIPYGKTLSYKELALMIDNPKAIRAVGGANNKNPIAIIVPCHRVIGANGKLVGYASGVEKKQFLLNLEKENLYM